MRLLSRFFLLLTLLVLIPDSAAFAEGGMHIVVIEPNADSTWSIIEFVDNSLIQETTGEIQEIPANIGSAGGESGTVEVMSAKSQPLILFFNEILMNLEERIIAFGRAQIEARLRVEAKREIVGGLFQVPAWPYIAVSEVPTKLIEIDWYFRLDDWRRYQFPAANYAGKGDFHGWQVQNTVEQGFYIYDSEEPGEGKGIVINYIYRGDIEDLIIPVPKSAHISAIYLTGDYSLVPPVTEIIMTEPWEILGPVDEYTTNFNANGLLSAIRTSDSGESLGRFIFVPVGDPLQSELVWTCKVDPEPNLMIYPGAGPDLSNTIFLCWFLFGVSVLTGNWIYRFSNSGSLELLVRAIVAYPLFLFTSLLAAGFWGLGFIPSAVLIARFISPEGKRLAASGVVIASSFVVMFISWIIVEL